MSHRRAIPPHSDSVELRNQRSQIDGVVQAILALAAELGYPEASKFAIRLAVEEAVSNAFHHGHKGLPPETPITLGYQISAEQLEVTVRDRGPGFQPETVPDPTLDQNIEIPSGRGLLLMRAYMAKVSYNDRGNEVRMVYRKPGPRRAS